MGMYEIADRGIYQGCGEEHMRAGIRRIAVTGPTGAIGMALMELCIQEEIEVLAICHKGSARIANIPDSAYLTVLEADLTDYAELDADQLGRCDGFYHFAWNGTTGEARNDMLLQSHNIEYTMEAVNLAHRLGCSFFVGAGSQAEYGRVEGELNASVPVWPENGYGMAKLCAGQMSRVMCERFGMRHLWTRILSVYGPFDGAQSLVSSAIRLFAAGENGAFTGGEQKWDYLYSRDAARLMLALGEKGQHGKIYCLGSGSARELRTYIEDIYDAVREYRHMPPEDETQRREHLGIGQLPYPAKQVMYLCADTTALRDDLGELTLTPFAQGIRETVEHADRCGC